MHRPSSKPLSGSEWAELGQLLRDCGGPDALDVDALHGLLTVAVIGPAPVMPSQWMPLAFGGEPIFDHQRHAQRFVALAMQLHNQIADALERDQYRLARRDRRGKRVALDPCSWTRGFCLGLELDEAAWNDDADHDPQFGADVDLLIAFGAAPPTAPSAKVGRNDPCPVR